MKLTKRDIDDTFLLDFGTGTAPIFLTEEEMGELRAHFLVERDVVLERWRHADCPNCVVYLETKDVVWVVDEETGLGEFWSRNKVTNVSHALSEPALAAKRFFEAHPEPKPWHAAAPREVWVITVNGEELLCHSNSVGDFTPVFGHHHWVTISNGSREITAGRRIWPEGEASE